MDTTTRLVLLVLALVLAITGSFAAARTPKRDPSVVVGFVPLDDVVLVAEDEPPHREPPPPPPPRPRLGGLPRFSQPAARGLWPPDGMAPGPPKPFDGQADASGGLQFVLILGSDARSGDPAKSRADSIHILAIDPAAGKGTILGIPRDSYVQIPGVGRRKINDSLSSGGPELAVRTVREVTGIPVTYYILTAFEGFRAVVNDLGGVDAYVPYDMNNWQSGAFFQKGWHRMDGEKALAFSRNRHVPAGDFARSENQGRLMLDVLKKLRAETSNTGEVEAWVRILMRHVRLNLSAGEALRFGVLARVTAAAHVSNVVAPGRTGNAGGASVVFLGDEAKALFEDVRADAIVNGNYPVFGPPSPPEATG
ncbi:MAG TPA: LCP family protein [Actinomycetota bacterium]|nr:LCP family protein [Actinomycetota bacterium]